jgi:hypothetical protein
MYCTHCYKSKNLEEEQFVVYDIQLTKEQWNEFVGTIGYYEMMVVS